MKKTIERIVDSMFHLLHKKRTMVVVGAFATCLLLPSLSNGWLVDDLLFHDRYFNQGERNLLKQFTFNSFLEEERFSAERREGVLPWWASSNLHVSFFRPLAALTHQLDYTLWPESKVLMQAHNLFWFVLVLFTTAYFFRKFYKTALAAGLAFLFFALDDSHGFPVGWLANRNALIALFMGVWSLYFYRKHTLDNRNSSKQHTSTQAYWISLVCFALSLLAGEAGIQTAAYLFAWAVFFGPQDTINKARQLFPFAVIGISYLILLKLLDFGAHGSGLYTNPLASPVEFLTEMPIRLVQLLAGQLLFPPSHISQLLPPLFSIQMVMIGLGLPLVLWYLYKMLKGSQTARFWALGGSLCLIPLCSTLPMDRNLWFVGLGGAGLLAEYVIRISNYLAMAPLPRTTTGRLERKLCIGTSILLFLVHTVWASILLLVTSIYPDRMSMAVTRAADSLAGETKGKHVVLLNSPSHLLFGYSLKLLQKSKLGTSQRGPVISGNKHSLTAGFAGFAMMRVDDRTLSITADKGFNNYSMDKYFRNPGNRYEAGQVYKTSIFNITIVQVHEGLPAAIRVDLKHPAHDYEFYQWKGTQFERTRLPEQGQSMVFETSLESAVRAIMTPVFADWTLAFLKLLEKES
jgi:hypothetical protein